jgi:TatD DNase family protein
MIDTHSHIYAEEFDQDRHEALQRAWDAGVEMMLLPDIDSQSRERMLALAKEQPLRCKAMAGLHPTSVNDNPHWLEELDMVERMLRDAPVPMYGVGEIGLDLYWSRDYYNQQRETLHAQLELALKYNKPVVIHTRDAYKEMLDAVATYRGRGLRGVFHAYASDVDMARRLLRNGEFAFGIGGVVTFKNGGLDRVVADMPLEVLLLETDSPYLTPVPHRGKRNEPSYVRYVCEKIALLHNTTPDRVDAITTSTTKDIFCI